MTDIEILRHAVATLAYRAAKTMRGAPESFASYSSGPSSNTPLVIVGHMADLIEWGTTIAQGSPKWHYTKPESWDDECNRFFAALGKFDDALASANATESTIKTIFQGPIADALTHTGQLAMLRRLSGNPMKGERYSRADIEIGRVGSEQTPPNPGNEFE